MGCRAATLVIVALSSGCSLLYGVQSASDLDAASADVSCSDDLDCASSVCDRVKGVCVDEDTAIYLDPEGTATSDCGKLRPCASLHDGLLELTPVRRTIKLAAGIYPEHPPVIDADPLYMPGRLQLIGYGAKLAPSVPVPNSPVLDIRDATVEIQGLAVSGALDDGEPGLRAYGIRCDHGALTATGVVVEHNAEGGIHSRYCDLKLVGAMIRENSGAGLHIHAGSALIANSVIKRNTGGKQAGGIYLNDNSCRGDTGEEGGSYTLVFNTIVQNSATPQISPPELSTVDTAGDAIRCRCPYGKLTAAGNILFNPGGGATREVGDPGFCTFSYSIIPGQADVWPDQVNFDDWPQLSADDDFHLTASSPGKDIAELKEFLSDSVLPGWAAQHDFDGEQRQNGDPDIGADEHW